MIKRVGLTLALAFTPMLASAQPYVEDLPLIKGSKGTPMLCTRSDSASYTTSAVGDASFCAVNSAGALQVNLDSTFQSGTSLIRAEDSAHTSGQPGIMALGVLNTGLNQLAGTDGDYSPIGLGARGNIFSALWYDAQIGASGPTRLEDDSIGEGTPLVMVGARRVDTLTSNPGATGDAGHVNQTATGALWATLTPSTTGGWSPYKASALTNSAVTVKASAGNLGGYHCLNAAAAITYIQIFDTSGAVTLGTTTPVLSFGLPASGAGNLEFSNGVNFANAIKVAATTTAGGSTAPATAMDCNFLYK